MANPMMQMLGQSTAKRMPNNPLALMAEFRKFAQNMTPDRAQKEVEQLLASGKMSQAQFEDLKQQAEELAKFLK